MTKYRPVGVALAFFFVVLFVGALGLRIWASGKATQTPGPSHIAAAPDRVVAYVDGQLFVFSPDGNLVERKDVSGLAPAGSLIDMRLLQDGRLLLATQQPAGIHLCTVTAWQCTSVGTGIAGKFQGQIKVVADEATRELYITDSAGSRLWRESFDGDKPKALLPAGVLKYPNDIARDAGGNLWIADSGHHRIVMLDKGGDDTWSVTRTITAQNRLTRDNRDWPMMLAMGPSGNWWVAQPTSELDSGDLLIYDPLKGAPTRVELPEDAYPTDIARLGASMLVTDMDRCKIYRVDGSSHTVSEYGDASFQELMQHAAARKVRYQALVSQSLIGMIASGVLMFAAAFWASPKDRRFTPSPKSASLVAGNASMPELQGIYWLQRNAKTERLLRWAKRFLYFAFMFLLVSLGSIYLMTGPHHGGSLATSLSKIPMEKRKELETGLLLTVYVFASLPILMHFQGRSLQNRIGTDGQRLFVRLFDGHQISVEPARLVYTTRLIAWQDQVFPVRAGNGGPLYADGELETYIAPLLSRAKKLTPWGMSLYLIQNREPGTMASWIFVLVLVVVLTATGSWPYVWRILLHRHRI